MTGKQNTKTKFLYALLKCSEIEKARTAAFKDMRNAGIAAYDIVKKEKCLEEFSTNLFEPSYDISYS